MKRHTLNIAAMNTSHKWKAGLLLLLFVLCSGVIIYDNIHTFSKQKYSLNSDEDAPVWEELDEEGTGDYQQYLSVFVYTESTYIREVRAINFLYFPNLYQISYIQNIPLFIKNRVLRL